MHVCALLNVYETRFVPSLQNTRRPTIFLHVYMKDRACSGCNS